MITVYVCKSNKLDRNGNPIYLIDSNEYIYLDKIGRAAHINDNGRVRKVVSYNIKETIANELGVSPAKLNVRILYV